MLTSLTQCVITECIMNTNNYTHFIHSKTGQLIGTRPLQPQDADLLVDIFNHMGSWSRYQRFHQTVDHVSDSRAHQVAEGIVQRDTTRKWGIIAFADVPDETDVPIGVSRYVETEQQGEAEVAISLRDDFHNQGIGKQLMAQTVEQAREAGFKRVIAAIQNDNPAIWYVFEQLPYEVTRQPDGTMSNVIIDLTRPQPHKTSRSSLPTPA